MKKQILFLTFFVLALFVGMNSAFAQPPYDDPQLEAVPASCPIPTPLDCGTNDELHPLAGKTYTYTIDHTGGTGSVVHWFVADATTPLITAGAVSATIDPDGGTGSYILDATDAAYNQGVGTTAPNASASIDISWKAFDATKNVVLVAFVTDALGCTNNIQAWKIEPEYSFIIEIAGIMPNGTTTYDPNGNGYTNANECVSPVQSAIWDGSAIAMDYGDNYVYYNVTAANWVHGWTPAFSAAITGGASTLGTVEWTYAADAADPTATWHPATDPVLAANYTSAVNDAIGPDGACIVLRVLVTHGAVEVATAGEQIAVTVDGVMYNPATDAYDTTYPDLDNAAAGADCVVGSNDVGLYDITPRPNITPNTPTDVFETKN